MHRFLNLFALILTVAITLDGGEPAHLSVKEKTIYVKGKLAKVYTITQPDGTWGLRIKKSEPFNVILKNEIQHPTSIHWHGLILPNGQDGVAFINQFAQYPGQSYHYNFPLVQSGTYWMHSHLGLQEQSELSAPLIIYGNEDEKLADKEAIVFLTDFSFTSPSEIFRKLTCNCEGKKMAGMQDLAEVDYDAFLINYRTVENPEIVEVKSGEKLRLRIINGSSATNFFIRLGDLKASAIAVDGERILPLEGSSFELGVANRIDLLLTIPNERDTFPILAQGEGTDKQTGLILAKRGAFIPQIAEIAEKKAPAFTNAQELKLRAAAPLKKRDVNQKVEIVLGGNMQTYRWTLNGQSWPEVTPIVVEKGSRVEIAFKNETTMSHPMHLHGHIFQVTEIDGKAIEGALRDTVMVLPNSTVKIQFDADNPGDWPLHCHILYHLEAGMLTVLRYKGYNLPLPLIMKDK